MERLSLEEARHWTRVGVLAAFALVLGYLETFIPIPVPGVKLGLANIAILLCFLRLDASSALFVTLIKVLAQGLLFGSPLTFAYSLTGSLLAFVVMAATVRIPGMHPVMVSILGAVAHTAGQMAVAAVLLGTRFVWLAAPVLLIAAIVAGAICGVLTVRLDRALGERGEVAEAAGAISLEELPETTERPVGLILLGFAVFAVVALLQTEVLPLAILFACAAVACAVVRTPLTLLWRGLRAFLVLLVVSAVATYASSQPGEALGAILVMVLRLGAVMVASIAVMGFVSMQELLAFTVGTARRLETRGVATQGPLLALNVCLQSLPVLAAGFGEGGKRPTRETLVDTIADAYAQADALALALVDSGGEGTA